MCGIFAAVSETSVTATLVNGLRALSYRGYDSSGLVIAQNSELQRRRAPGKLEALSDLLQSQPLEGMVGIAHTRWATHGEPTECNAHPHMTSKVAVVHNGIIENYPALKADLEADGYRFCSDTDSESIPLLITRNLDMGQSPETALRNAVVQLDGSFAIAVIFAAEPETVYAARCGSPLVIGQGVTGHFISSDSIALASVARNLCMLEDGDVAKISVHQMTITDAEQNQIQREMKPLQISEHDQGKQGYRHYMLKEIHQQPEVVRNTLNHYCNVATKTLKDAEFPHNLERFDRLSVVACGTSYYAGMVARHWFEQFAALPVDADVASEYRYRGSPLSPNTLSLFISQSGETADTLAALRYTKEKGLACMSLLNVATSTMAAESDHYLRTLAGAEIGVASTKAFTGQLTVLLLTALRMAKANGQLAEGEEKAILETLFELPVALAQVIDQLAAIQSVAASLVNAKHTLFLGRGVAFPLAQEGALKLKEISYIHAEAYPAGELKHGPIALIDSDMPVVLVAPPGPMMGKTLSNLREVAARGAKVILISNREGIELAADHISHAIEMPDCDPVLVPLLYTLPLQLLAYHVACMKGTDVDQPRNLAKSVTVE